MKDSIADKIAEEAGNQMRALDARGGVVAQLDAAALLGLVGAAQLALRHPGFSGKPSASYVKAWIVGIADQLRGEYPALAHIIDLGFNPKFDPK